MRQVAILGIGQIKVDEHWDLSLRELGGNAAFAAMQDAGMDKVDALFVGNMLSPMVSGQNQLGTYFSDWIGLWDQESVKVEAACASGAAALRSGLMAVSSGETTVLAAASVACGEGGNEAAGSGDCGEFCSGITCSGVTGGCCAAAGEGWGDKAGSTGEAVGSACEVDEAAGVGD